MQTPLAGLSESDEIAGDERQPAPEHRAVFPPPTGQRVAWHAYLPVGVAVCSLLVALFSLYSQRATPDISLSMPDRVRVYDGARVGGIYFQPRFISAGTNDRVEVVTDLHLTVTRDGESESVPLSWDEQGNWIYDSGSDLLTWTFVADPAPLVVTRSSPQLPVCLFLAPEGWQWQAGTYTLHLEAKRRAKPEPLTGQIAFAVTPEQASAMATSPGTFFEIPVEPEAS